MLNDDGNILTVSHLIKKYADVDAVSDISFGVMPGMLFAFLGPNGAGKSTTIDILCTLLRPTNGEIMIDGFQVGKDDDEIRKRIGVVFQQGVLDSLLTVRENLETRASFYKMSRPEIKEAINRVSEIADLGDFLDRPYGKLSGGQKRRADIARALINSPKILFLDEPTTGLDPQTKKNLWNTILNLQKESGTTVFLTTHYMEEAATADHIVIINKGKIVADGTPYELKEKHCSDCIKLMAADGDSVRSYLNDNHIDYFENNDLFTINLKDTMESIPIIQNLKSYIESFEVLHGSMEDAFINIIGKGELK